MTSLYHMHAVLDFASSSKLSSPIGPLVSAHHPSRTWRGCAMCKPHKRRGTGRAVKEPTFVLRKLGKKRRVSRRDLGT
jgi:hypothetical protein